MMGLNVCIPKFKQYAILRLLEKRLNIFVQGEEFLFGVLDTIVSSSSFSYHYET